MSVVRRMLAPALLGACALCSRVLPPPLSAIAFLPAIALFPGMAAVGLVARGAPALARITLALAIAPLVASLAGWGLLAAGGSVPEAADRIGLWSWGLWTLAELLPSRSPNRGVDAALRPEAPGPAVGWAAAMAALVALPPLLNPWVRVHSDSWIHAGIVWEIVQHGVPPTDPRFAGLPLNFVWFYNLYAALLGAGRGGDPLAAFAANNVVLIAAFSLAAWHAGWALWRDRRAAFGAMVLATVGFNAGAWLLWPLRFVLALTGEVRGLDEVRRQLALDQFGTTDVLMQLSAPFARMVSFLDKFLIGSSMSTAWVAMLVCLWGAVVWLRTGWRPALAWCGLGASGTLFFHGVAGLSVVPVAIAATVVAAVAATRVPWMPRAAALVPLAAALAAGALAAAPYTLGITSGWTAERSGIRHDYVRPGTMMPWTLLTTSIVAWALALPALRRAVAARDGVPAWLALHAAGMIGFALVVHLPLTNEHKFAFLAFVPAALIGGAGLPPALDAAASRWGRVRVAAAAALLFGTTPALTVAGYLADPRAAASPRATLPAPEAALYAWIRERTPRDAVFVDHRSRDLVMVWGRRRLLAGTTFGPELAAFPAAELAARRAVEADLFGALARLDDDVRLLAALQAPAFVIYRASDFRPGTEPWRAIDADPRFALRYDHDGFRVYALGATP